MSYVEPAESSFLTGVMLVFLAFIFPPAVAILRGSLRQVALSLILTLLGWIPGVIYALVILARRPNRRSPAGLEERAI